MKRLLHKLIARIVSAATGGRGSARFGRPGVNITSGLKRNEEIARELHQLLTARLADAHRSLATVNLHLMGVNSSVTAERDSSSCRIFCFPDLPIHAAEFLLRLQRDGQPVAAGRSRDRDVILRAAVRWLEPCSREQLYQEFDFIDAAARQLSEIHTRLAAVIPELDDPGVCERPQAPDNASLSYTSGDRTARILYQDPAQPGAAFLWDKCALFQTTPPNDTQLALMLKRWVLDAAKPSQMRLEFPGLTMAPLADHYENGTPEVGEFLRSWDQIMLFFADHPQRKLVSQFLTQLRQAGYDSRLRAGQSMWTFCLSRSRRHGLRPDQPSVSFHFRDDGTMDIRHYGLNLAPIPPTKIELSGPLAAVLDALAERPVD